METTPSDNPAASEGETPVSALVPSRHPPSDRNETDLNHSTNLGKDVAKDVTGEVNFSRFERLITSCPPIIESFYLQCPTETLFTLYHTSRYLRSSLESYPLAWRDLSFRLADPTTVPPTPVATENELQDLPADHLIKEIVVPNSLNLRSLILDNTSVHGDTLASQVLLPRRSTLEHLSVRGCGKVSLKYTILPFLQNFVRKPAFKSRNPSLNEKSALKSLYVYRCRHHRRRPYLASSTDKQDSDSYATHQLILECRRLGIWLDTAWCTTPAGRCQRRRSYANSRLGQGPPEVWVPFDRLWRSRNRIGGVPDTARDEQRAACLWEQDEDGYDGEPLGNGLGRGEGKTVPTHLRRSHKIFIDDIKCDKCKKDIPERCEQCSILMHCMGCRKTLCSDCAFDKPYLIYEPVPISPNDRWWAPGYAQSPNLLKQPEYGAGTVAPRIKMRWCCTEPMFSQGGGITFALGTSEVAKCDRIRAAPLPRGHGWEDKDFAETSKTANSSFFDIDPDWDARKQKHLIRTRLGHPSRKTSPCPRVFCDSCHKSPLWKVNCNGCRKPLCNEHELRGLRLRMCGYRDLGVEKSAYFQEPLIEERPEELAENVRFDFGAMVITEDERGHFEHEHNVNTSNLPTLVKAMIEFYRDPENVEAFRKYIMERRPETVESCMRDIEELTAIPTDPETDVAPTKGTSASNMAEGLAFVSFRQHSKRKPWFGCQAIFCPQYRPLLDRPRCPSLVRECSTCRVYVCATCRKGHPPCKCSYCTTHYNCPNCYNKLQKDVCRKEIEEAEERQRKVKLEKDRVERAKLNEEIGVVGEFFEGLMSQDGAKEEKVIEIDKNRPEDPSEILQVLA